MTTTRGVGQVSSNVGTGTAGPGGGLAGTTPATPGVGGGIPAITGVSRAVLWVPPVAGSGMQGALESPLQNLRVGQQVSAQVLVTDAAAGRALLLMDGQRVAAEVPDGLQEGQVVNLAVASVTSERLVLRLTEGGSGARTPTAPLDASAVLRALDLPDTPATRAVVTALVERGQPLTRETIAALRSVVAREAGQEIQNARGAVDALLRGIPVTLRSAVLARTASPAATAAPMGDLLMELMAAIDAVPPGVVRTPVDVSAGGVAAQGVPVDPAEASPVPADPSPAATARGAAPPPGTMTADARGALARLVEGMTAQGPSAAELQRVVSVLHGAPEARLAQMVLAATSGEAAVALVPGTDAATAPVAPGPLPTPAGAVAVVPGGGTSAAGAMPTPAPGVGSGVPQAGAPVAPGPGITGAPGSPLAVPGADGASARGSGSPAPGSAGVPAGRAATAAAGSSVVATAVPVALVSSPLMATASAWVAAGPDARSFLGALIALFGGTARPGSPAVAATPPAPAPGGPGTPVPAPADRGSVPAALLARVIHDRLEYQQLGNAAVMARGGWEAAGGSAATVPGATVPAPATTGARPEAGVPTTFASLPAAPPGDALTFSIPLAFAGQMATLELAVWRDGGRRQEAQEEATPGLHARVRLDLAQLGRVGADIRIAGTNLRCRLTADREATNALFREHGEALLDRLRAVGFTVEGLDYRPLAGAVPEAPGRTSVVRRVDMGV